MLLSGALFHCILVYFWFALDINDNIYFGTSLDVPQLGVTPKNKSRVLPFFNKDAKIGSNYHHLPAVIFDEEDKKIWEILARPYSKIEGSRLCGKPPKEQPINIKSIKNMDLNLLRFIIESYSKDKVKKDISIWVKNKPGKQNEQKNYTIFSLTKNKYINNIQPSYFICDDRDTAYAFDREAKNFKNIVLAYKDQENIRKQKIIDKEKRKSIKVTEDTDQGMILQIKGPLVLVQTEICTMKNNYGTCLGYGKTTEWVKKDELTFNIQNR